MDTKYKILIVDDDAFLLSMYEAKFKKNNFDVVTSSGGNDALKKLREGLAPDVITLDMVMPEMDGVEFLAQMRKENLAKGSVLVVLSNQSQTADIEKATQYGIDGYIVKATTIPSEVVNEVEKIIKEKFKK